MFRMAYEKRSIRLAIGIDLVDVRATTENLIVPSLGSFYLVPQAANPRTA